MRERIAKLKAMKKWILAHRHEIVQALHDDFRKPAVEAEILDVKPVITELDDAIANLKDWMRPQRVSKPLVLLGSRSKTIAQPKGVALILSPWNFPFNLAVGPAVSAIAAGCCVIIKPSEYTSKTSAMVAEMAAELFTEQEFAVVQGEVEVAQELLKLPFNHIFFTGSPQVGKHVMHAAAEHLASVTLELGGSNPCVVDTSGATRKLARRILWGGLMNAGQSCLSVNTLYVHDSVHDAFLKLLKEEYTNMFGEGATSLEDNPDTTAIINHRNFKRVEGLLNHAIEQGAKVEAGGKCAEDEHFIAPTLLSNVNLDMEITKEEIFGPIIPIAKYSDQEELANELAKRPKPLVFYLFSKSAKANKFWERNTSSGMMSINETHIFFNNMQLPFGGDNTSGIGKGHGHHGFLEFSNTRAHFKQWTWYTPLQLVFPPYTDFKKKLIGFITRKL